MLGEYLGDGSAQERLLAQMETGHARQAHGAELGHPSNAAYRARVRSHLANAPLGFAVQGADGRPRFLIADPRANQVAWITPHKEHRSTFFEPRRGVAGYIRYLRDARPAERWRRVDLRAVRAAEASQTARRVSTADRAATAGRGVAR